MSNLTDRELYLKRNKERPWYKHWKAARQRCNDKNAQNYKYYGGKGIKCLLTEEELKKLWFRDKAKLFKEAHLSRKNHCNDYSFNNCYFSPKKQNIGESNQRNKSKVVLQFDLNGNFIKEWESVTAASRGDTKRITGISKTALGYFKQSYGYIWRYK